MRGVLRAALHVFHPQINTMCPSINFIWLFSPSFFATNLPPHSPKRYLIARNECLISELFYFICRVCLSSSVWFDNVTWTVTWGVKNDLRAKLGRESFSNYTTYFDYAFMYLKPSFTCLKLNLFKNRTQPTECELVSDDSVPSCSLVASEKVATVRKMKH